MYLLYLADYRSFNHYFTLSKKYLQFQRYPEANCHESMLYRAGQHGGLLVRVLQLENLISNPQVGKHLFC